MCGIVGYISEDNLKDLELNTVHMLDAISHRGPDDSGIWIDSKSGVSLGHRRLSVLETSQAGHQPMVSNCGRYVIVFNGEIYNHLSLRDKLDVNFEWKGGSDTETLLESISKWGLKKALKSSVGMFAFAVWDKKNKTLSLARDRLGEKPLFYGWCQDQFVFASELKALKKLPKFNNSINRDALALYFQFSNVPSPHSIFENIYKLDSGQFVTLKRSELRQKLTKITSYWSLINEARHGAQNLVLHEDKAIEMVDFALRKSLSEQSIADVPLGAFLSGGIDSSLIVSLLQSQSDMPIQTFTVGFDEKEYDESVYAKAVASHLKTQHHEIRVTSKEAISVIEKLPELYDEPFSDSSQIPTFLICQASRKNVTVALSGDGGDELFGGYNRYLWGPILWKRIKWMPFPARKILGSVIKTISIDNWNKTNNFLFRGNSFSDLGGKAHKFSNLLNKVNSFEALYLRLVSEWQKDDQLVIGANDLMSKLASFNSLNEFNDPESMMMLMDGLTYLPDDILTKVDRASMGISLETRAPFLDHRLVELAWRLPLNMKVRGREGKWVLRQILDKHVPRKLIDRPKTGFGVPIGEWLRGPLREWAESLIDRSSLLEQGFLNVDLVHKYWNEHLQGDNDWTGRIWSILVFQSWLEKQ
jgi:asparagine synthase (glutamine-hydrolysing)